MQTTETRRDTKRKKKQKRRKTHEHGRAIMATHKKKEKKRVGTTQLDRTSGSESPLPLISKRWQAPETNKSSGTDIPEEARFTLKRTPT